jgi:hypothetical protein
MTFFLGILEGTTFEQEKLFMEKKGEEEQGPI